MEIDDQIRAWLLRYLGRQASLEDFEAWLTPTSWDLDPVADPVAEGLAARILLRLAELSNGDLTEDELRRDLMPLVQWQVAPQPTSFAGTTSLVVQPGGLTAGSSAVRKSPAVVSG